MCVIPGLFPHSCSSECTLVIIKKNLSKFHAQGSPCFPFFDISMDVSMSVWTRLGVQCDGYVVCVPQQLPTCDPTKKRSWWPRVCHCIFCVSLSLLCHMVRIEGFMNISDVHACPHHISRIASNCELDVDASSFCYCSPSSLVVLCLPPCQIKETHKYTKWGWICRRAGQRQGSSQACP